MSEQTPSYLDDFVGAIDNIGSKDLLNLRDMLEAIGTAHLEELPRCERNDILTSLQGFLIEKVEEYYRPLRIEHDPTDTTWQSIHSLLAKAAEAGKEGPVAQYLLGAKLQLRFPDIEISNQSYSTADAQLGRQGDFYVGDTVFHVTVAPMPAVIEKCKRNVDQGFRAYLLVPDRLVAGTKQNVELQAAGKISVQSIESFVSQNIDELSGFSTTEVKQEFRQLLEIYNRRVDAIEMNKSMMIEIPANLRTALDP